MKKNIVYIVLIVLLIGTIIYGTVERINVEKDLNNVEVVLDYNSFYDMAKDSEHDIIWWFNYLNEAGAHAVAVEEESIMSLIEEGHSLESTVLMNLQRDVLWDTRYPKSFVDYINTKDYDENDVVILSKDADLKEFILSGLEQKYDSSFYQLFEEKELYAILLDGKKSDLLYASDYKIQDEKEKDAKLVKRPLKSKLEYYKLGFSEEKLENVKKSTLKLNLRASNNELFPKKQLAYYKDILSEYNSKEDYIIFAGKEVLGYPHTEELKDFMEGKNILPVLIETQVQRSNIDQKGINDLVRKMDYKAIRLLPIVPYIQERYQYYGYQGAEEIENVIFRAVTERNIRLIYYRPFLFAKKQYVTDPEEYKLSFERLKARLSKHHIGLDGISVMKENENSIYYPLLISIGILGVLALLFKLLFKIKDKYLYLAIIILSILVFIALKIAINLSVILISLGTAIITGMIGALFISLYAKNILMRKTNYSFLKISVRSTLFTILMAIIPLIGGLIIASVLSSSEYLLEMKFYRGVKLSENLPILLFIITYVLILGFNRNISDMKNEISVKEILTMLNVNVKLFHIVLGIVGAGVLMVYIARSGHESGIEPSKMEILFRNLLENKLFVRPRLKEFMIAIPSLMILSYSAYRGIKKLIFVFSLGSMIVFTSIVNTFCHLRTPLYISIARTFIGIGLGILIGIVLIGILEMIIRVRNKTKKKKELVV